MFRIGEFSRIAQLAVTQLRYYDDIRLFQPKHIDQFTGYRYYDASQLPDLNRILAMKELGLTLEQIKRLVAENVSPDEIRGMLTLKKAQVEQELHEQIGRLHHIEARLRQVEQDGTMSADDVVLKELQAQPIYSFRDTLPDLRQSARMIGEITKMLPSRVGKKKLGYFAAIFHSDAFVVENADVEMGFLLNEGIDEPFPLSSGHALSMRILPHVEVAACVVRVGGFENGYESYGNVGRWIAANGYRILGPVREVYIMPPNPAKIEETVCEIQIPVVSERSTTQFASLTG